MDYDEATYARVMYESFERNDFLLLTKNGQPYFDKPPGYFWLMAASVSVLGETEFAMRLPSTLLITVAILLTYLITLQLTKNRYTALCASFILLTTGTFLEVGRQVRLDIPVTCAILFTFYAFLKGLENPKWHTGIGLGLMLGFFFKLVVGFLAAPLILIAAVIYQRWDWLKSKYFWIGNGIGALLVIAWHVWLAGKIGTEFLYRYYISHFLARPLSHVFGETDPYVFIKGLFQWAQPWFLVFIVLMCIFLFKKRLNAREYKPELTTLAVTLFIYLAFELGSQDKLFSYLAPAFPFMAMFIASASTLLLTEIKLPLLRKKQLIIVCLLLLSPAAIANTSQQIYSAKEYSGVAGIYHGEEVISRRLTAEEERKVAYLVLGKNAPVYLLGWPHHETLNYYGDFPQLIMTDGNEKLEKPSFLLLPTALFEIPIPALEAGMFQINENTFRVAYYSSLFYLLETVE